jgi:hypothetical protein
LSRCARGCALGGLNHRGLFIAAAFTSVQVDFTDRRARVGGVEAALIQWIAQGGQPVLADVAQGFGIAACRRDEGIAGEGPDWAGLAEVGAAAAGSQILGRQQGADAGDGIYEASGGTGHQGSALGFEVLAAVAQADVGLEVGLPPFSVEGGKGLWRRAVRTMRKTCLISDTPTS